MIVCVVHVWLGLCICVCGACTNVFVHVYLCAFWGVFVL